MTAEDSQKAVVTAWPEDWARYALELTCPLMGTIFAVTVWGQAPLWWLVLLGIAEVMALATTSFILFKLGDYRPKYLFSRREDMDEEVVIAAALSPWKRGHATAWTMELDRITYHYDVEVHIAAEGRELRIGMPAELWENSTEDERRFLFLAQLIRKWKVRALWRLALLRLPVYMALAGISIYNGWLGVLALMAVIAACVRFLPYLVHGRNDGLAAKQLSDPRAALSALELVARESDPAFPKPFLAARIKMMQRRLRKYD